MASDADRFRALADAMPHLVWIATATGEVVYYNARAREYAGLEATGDGTWRWQPIVHPDDLDRTWAAWRDAVASGAGTYACEHRMRMAGGGYRWHVSRAQLAGLEWFGTATDIHDLKAVEQDLRRTAAMRDQVVSVVAHDLRSPLAVVGTSLPGLRRAIGTCADPGARQRADASLTRMERQLGKVERLLDELLDVATLEAGKPLELERRDGDLAVVLRDVVAERSGPGARHPIELRLATPSLVGRWDVARVERVIENLLSNAVKYSPPGSPITVEMEWVDGQAVVRVRDRGIGVPDADRERIFDWLTRGANAADVATGSGIGLAGARRIVEQHGGTLTVDSALGAGSTFVLTLPVD